MKRLARIGLVLGAIPLVAVVALFAGVGPLGPLPGGVLWGERADPPPDWSFTDGIAEIELETRVAGIPWSVTVWCIAHEGVLHVPSGDCGRRWTRAVQARSEVRVRVEGRVYEMNAARLPGDGFGAELAPLLFHKYFGIVVEDVRPVGDPGPGCAFRLEPRA